MKQIIFFDTETTGIPLWRDRSDSVDQPHIVQIAALRVEVETRKVIEMMDVVVAPDGWEIPQVTIDIHGITNDHASEIGIPEKEAVQMFLYLWNGMDWVSHGKSFDKRIMRIALKRWADEVSIETWKECPSECTGQLSRKIVGLGKMPKLVEAYQHFFSREHDGIHSAMGDAVACMEIYFAIKDFKP